MADREHLSLPCNLCGARDVDVLSLGDRDGNALRTVICNACGLVWTDARPDDRGAYYARRYRLDYKRAVTPRLKHVYRAGRVAIDRYRNIAPFLKSGARVLDVGSGGGELLYLLVALGYPASGIEPNLGYAEYSRAQYGLAVDIGMVQDVDLDGECYDGITMFHVLEHTGDPAAVLARLRAALRADGTLIVEVPNVEAICQAPRNRFHRAHLYNFNAETLRLLGAREGFEQTYLKISPDGGNLLAVFARKDPRVVTGPLEATTNAQTIKTTITTHTALKHYLTRGPYRRALKKIARSRDEKRWSRRFRDGKALSDTLYDGLRAGFA